MMRRLAAALRLDTRLQFRNGFYLAAAIVAVAVAALFSLLPKSRLAILLPPLLFGNLVMNCFYFIGGLVLLEKRERTLEPIAVSPLTETEYLISKLLSLTLLALLENLFVVLVAYGPDVQMSHLVTGLILLSGFYCSVGFLSVIRYDSINTYIMPSMLFATPLLLPLVSYLGVPENDLFLLYPTSGALLFLKAAFQPVAVSKLWFGLFTSVAWLAILFGLSRRAFTRYLLTGNAAR